MNIQPVKTDGLVPPPKAKSQAAKPASSGASSDVYKPEQKEKLMNLLHSEPDARPEAVERARALVADPNYPSKDVLEKVARGLLSEPDRSE